MAKEYRVNGNVLEKFDRVSPKGVPMYKPVCQTHKVYRHPITLIDTQVVAMTQDVITFGRVKTEIVRFPSADPAAPVGELIRTKVMEVRRVEPWHFAEMYELA